MSVSAEYLANRPVGHQRLPGRRFDLELVERQMREVSDLDADSEGPVQAAIRHHLGSGGNRTRASIALRAGADLQLHPRDIVAIASAAELLHNASLVHDDVQDQAETRRNAASVWKAFGQDIAICTGDLLVSAAYAALASVSDQSMTAELVRVAHAATARVISGQAQDLKYQHVNGSDFGVYKYVAGEKSGPLLGLPLELVLCAAGFNDHVLAARDAATSLAIAYQITDDIEDELFDAQYSGCLNAVTVLRNAGSDKPRQAARYEALLALREATRMTLYLPSECGESMLDCIEAVKSKLKAVQ